MSYIQQTTERNKEMDRLVEISKTNNGFFNKTDTTVSFNEATREFSISPAATEYTLYSNGVEYIKTATESCTITDTKGPWYFYFDSTGTLQCTQTFDIEVISRWAFISEVYWNAANSRAIIFTEERHGVEMNSRTHVYLHLTRRAAWESGLALLNIDADASGNNNSSAVFNVEDGVYWDEDIRLDTTNSTQILTGDAEIPIWYKTGTSGDWNQSDADGFPLIHDGKAGWTGRAPFNEFTGGSWQLTETTNNDFFLVHYFATNNYLSTVAGNGDEPIIGILGEAEYPTRNAARDGAESEILQITTEGLPTPEFIPIATVIWQTSNSYSNTPKARIRSVEGGGDYINWIEAGIDPTSIAALPSHSINDHFDVDTTTTSPSTDDVLTWDGTNWVPGTVDAGGVFGTEFDESSAEGNTSTGSQDFVGKHTHTQTFTNGRKYRIGFYIETRHTDGGSECEWQLLVDGTEEARGGPEENGNTSTNQRHAPGGFVYRDDLSGSVDIELQYRDTQGDNDAHARRARIEVWRVS